MFDFGIVELVLIVTLALIFIGPEDLPRILFKLGRFFRGLNLYYQRTRNELSDILHDVEVEEYRKMYGDNILDAGSEEITPDKKGGGDHDGE